jgi:hypothetical protein
MPVEVVFLSSRKLHKKRVSRLTAALPVIVADALNQSYVRAHNQTPMDRDKVRPSQVYVVHHRRLDMDALPLRLHILAGEAKGRNNRELCASIAIAVTKSNTVPDKCLGTGKALCQVHFSQETLVIDKAGGFPR